MVRPSVDLPFADWLPDSPDYWSANAQTAQNCLPTLASPNYESMKSVSLTAIGNINGSSVVVNAVDNNGTAYLSTSSPVFTSNGKTFTCSFWMRVDVLTGAEQDILRFPGASGGVLKVYLDSSGVLTITGTNTSLTTILLLTSQTFSAGSTWYNVLINLDLSGSVHNIYINNASNITVTTFTNDNLDYSNGGTIFAGNAGANKSNICLAEIWANNSSFDFSNSSNRAKFIDGSGFPVSLGSTGQTPTGSSPRVYLKGAAGSNGVNSGAGPNYSIFNIFSIASSSPSDSSPTQYLGAFTAIDSTDTPHTYAGTTNKIAEISNSTATNVSKSGGYTAATIWKFTQFTGLSAGNLIIATDYNDAIQSMAVGSTPFADLAAAAPKASAIASVNQFLMLGDTSGGTYNSSTQGAIPNRVWWSAIGNPASWPDPATTSATAVQSGFKDLPPNYGRVQDIKGRYEYGIVFQENGISRFQYQGGDVPFYITTYEQKRGLYCRNGAIQIGNEIFFPHSSGFYKTDGSSVMPIGHNMVDQTWLADLNTGYLDHVRVSEIPDKKIILWAYPSTQMTLQGTFPICDKVIAYNYMDGRWAMGMVGQSIDMLFNAKSLAYTMEQLDSVNSNLDLITPSLDDPYWNGGNPIVGVFGIQLVSGSTYASYYGALTGTDLTATLDTKIANLNQGGRAFVTNYKPVVLGGSPTITGYVGTQTLLTDAITFGSATTHNTRTGKIPARSDAVFHTFRLSISGGFSNAMGVEPEWRPSGWS